MLLSMCEPPHTVPQTINKNFYGCCAREKSRLRSGGQARLDQRPVRDDATKLSARCDPHVAHAHEREQ